MRYIRSFDELSEDESFCVRSIKVHCRTHPAGRDETTMIKVTLYSERDTAKLLRMRNALKAAGHWPQEGT